MKRSCLLILAAIILLATAFTLLPASPSPVSAQVNLIQNPGFEEEDNGFSNPPVDWSYSGPTSLQYRADGRNSTYSAYLHDADSSYTQTVLIEGLAFYRFGAYIKASNATARVELTIRDSDGTGLATGNSSTNQTVWVKRIIYFDTPDAAYDVVIKLQMIPEEGASNPEAWFDDILLEQEGGCFIATAAYGTPTAGELDVLRAFRDQVLLESTLGAQFVAWYYQVSPPAADFISEHSLLRTVVRELLIDPMASLAKFTYAIWRD